MGKDLNGKNLGKGITQQKDGYYVARYTNDCGKRIVKREKTPERCRQWLNEQLSKEPLRYKVNDKYIDKSMSDEDRYYVYRFCDKDNSVLYVGKTRNIQSRTASHLSNSRFRHEAMYLDYITFDNGCDMSIYEQYLISFYNPPYNRDSKYTVGHVTLPVPDTWSRIPIDKIKGGV